MRISLGVGKVPLLVRADATVSSEREERTLIDVFVQKSSSSIAIVSQGPSTVEDRGVAWGKKPLRDGSTPAVEKRDGMTETP
ncbi:hypothetical protein BHM03_00042780 [Ensete ventricosum]|nr:hypothetical protein BHM03_00042780 [Ensete ventricosum]